MSRRGHGTPARRAASRPEGKQQTTIVRKRMAPSGRKTETPIADAAEWRRLTSDQFGLVNLPARP